MDDILKMEDIGRVVLTPDGSSVVFERLPAYETAPNIGALHSISDRSPLAKLFVFDPARSPEPVPLFEQEPQGGYWIGALSPNGRRLAIYMLVAGKVTAAVYTFSERGLTRFSFVPSYSWFTQKPVWISDDELAYPALPDERTPPVVDRSRIAAEISERWRKTFVGKEPSVSVLTSSPDGYNPNAPGDEGKILIANARTGQIRELGKGNYYNLRLSPGISHLATLRETGQHQPEANVPAPNSLEITRRALEIFDLRSGTTLVPCAGCDVVLGTIRWSADGRRLAFVADHLGEPARRRALFSYTIATQALQEIDTRGLKLACGTIIAAQVRVIPLADGVAVFGRMARESDRDDEGRPETRCDPGERHDWFLLREGRLALNLTAGLPAVSGDPVGLAGRKMFVLSGGDLWAVQDNGARTNLTVKVAGNLKTWDLSIEGARRSKEVVYTGDVIPTSEASLHTSDELIVFNLRKSSYSTLRKSHPESSPVSVSQAGRAAIFRADGERGSTLTWLRANDQPVSLAELNTHLELVVPARRAQLHYVSQGSKLSSCMLLPSDFRADHRYPLIVYVYPGASEDCVLSDVGKFNPLNFQLLAAQGYLVLFATSPRKLTMTGKSPTGAMTSVVLSAVDAAIAEGYADPERLGVFGLSQGQHSALHVLSETDRFRAAVVMHGISDYSSHYGTMPLRSRFGSNGFPMSMGDAGRYERIGSHNWVGVKPWEEPQRYLENSPVFFADRIRAPLLIMHSDLDVFPLGQSEQLFNAMYRLRREAVYVTYWGEAHGNLSPANVRDMWKRISSWYDRHLTGTALPPASLAHDPPVPTTSVLAQ